MKQHVVLGLRIMFIFCLIMAFIPYGIHEMRVLRTPFYVVPMTTLGTICGFLSFSLFTNYIYSKSLKFSDLTDTYVADPKKKEVYKVRHRFGMIVLSACLVGVLVYYMLYDYEVAKLPWLATLSILRGLITLYFDVQHTISKVLIKVLHMHKQRASTRNLLETKKHDGIEMTTPRVELGDVAVEVTVPSVDG